MRAKLKRSSIAAKSQLTKAILSCGISGDFAYSAAVNETPTSASSSVCSPAPWCRVDSWTLGALLGCVGLSLILTLAGHGIVWDSWEFYLGDCNLAFWLSGDVAQLDGATASIPWYGPDHADLGALSQQMPGNPVLLWPHEVWPVGATMSSLSKWLFHVKLGWLPLYEAHHLSTVGFALLFLSAVFWFVRRTLGRVQALAACLFLAAHPRLWAHMHNNFKDVPLLFVYTVCAGAFYVAIRDRRWRFALVSAVFWGLAMATKANALLLPFVLGPWFLIELAVSRGKDLDRRLIGALVAYPFIGLLTMFVLWPYLWLDFPVHVQDYVGSITKRGFEVEHEGHDWYRPLLYAVATCPLPMLGLALVGCAVRVRSALREKVCDPLLCLLLLWMCVPISRVVMPGAADFDVIRHWLEYLVPLAIFAGIGFVCLVDVLENRLRWGRYAVVGGSLCAVLAQPVFWIGQNQPNTLPYYNAIIGGLGGAQEKSLGCATDYWGGSYRTGMSWLNENAAEGAMLITGVAEHITLLASADPTVLREDVRPLYIGQLSEEKYAEVLTRYPGQIYLMYVTRAEWYHPAVRTPDAEVAPVFSVELDGGTAMKILQLK